jgi:glycosyltransferase involved in cell wall biosynthesis
MMKEFIKAGHTVVAAGNDPDPKWKDKLSEYGVRYLSFRVDRNGTSPVRDVRTFCDLYKIIKSEKPDKIFTYQAKTVIYGSLAARLTGNSEVYPLIAGVGSILLSEKPSLIKSIVKAEYKAALSKAKNIFFQNKSDIEVYTKLGIADKEKIVMINGSGVNLEKFTPLPLPEDNVFLFIGRLIVHKGVMEYLDAARIIKKKYPDTRFLIVGPFDTNPTAITLQDLLPYVEDGTVEYYGEQSDVREFLEKCRIFVLPSYREGTPKSVLEALACARPVITTDAPGCKETVEDGYNGFLVPVNNVQILCDKMELLINSKELTKTLASNARGFVEKKFDVREVNRIILTTMGIKIS